MTQPSILFVCLGNICRSPTAEAVFRKRAAVAGLDLRIDSAGTGAWHAGETPDSRAMEAAEPRGYSFAGQVARQVCSADFAEYDYILAMDQKNLAHLIAISPKTYSGTIALFMDFAKDISASEVPDPYYGGPDGFINVVNLIEAASDGLIETLS